MSQERGVVTREVRGVVTRLDARKPAADMRDVVRGRWRIENTVHTGRAAKFLDTVSCGPIQQR